MDYDELKKHIDHDVGVILSKHVLKNGTVERDGVSVWCHTCSPRGGDPNCELYYEPRPQVRIRVKKYHE
jgi:hypothetical protein